MIVELRRCAKDNKVEVEFINGVCQNTVHSSGECFTCIHKKKKGDDDVRRH